MLQKLNPERLRLQLDNEVEALTRRLALYSQRELQAHIYCVREELQTSAPTGKNFHQAFISVAAITNVALNHCYNKNFYPCQLLAGYVISTGQIAEMATGEGKTIVTLLPVVWHTLGGRQVHVATANEYLAERDWSELKPVFEELKISSGLTLQSTNEGEKQRVYQREVIFGAGSTFGFDYLRDQKTRQQRAAQRPGLDVMSRLRRRRFSDGVLQPVREVTIIDEADSLLLDEAMTPLVLSGEPNQTLTRNMTATFEFAQTVAESLEYEIDFRVAPQTKQIQLTQSGWDKIHAQIRKGLRLRRPWNEYVCQALRATYSYCCNEDYVVQNNKVQIVDAHTGRIEPDRAWQDGLHQAVECLEQVPISPERSTSARITRQHFYSLYQELSGMTGTAASATDELLEMYSTKVVQIPLHRPSQRRQLPTRWFIDAQSKHSAITDSVAESLQKGRAILIGTATIDQSEKIAKCLHDAGIEAVVLNGLQDACEAEIVAQAGKAGRVTIATNMAGRGTNIRPDQEALLNGGLHVIATQHHDSVRVDRQLIGRCGRQGEPGSYQFFIAASDNLITNHAPKVADEMRACADATGECQKDFTTMASYIQNQLEKQARIQRKNMLTHEQWMNTVRTSVG